MSRSHRLAWLLVLATLVLGGSGYGGGGQAETGAPVLRSAAPGLNAEPRDVLRRPDQHADYVAASRRNDQARANTAPGGSFGASRVTTRGTISPFATVANRPHRALGTAGSRAPPVGSDLPR
jgi:hypothetical protein